jgi:hypothetical protein
VKDILTVGDTIKKYPGILILSEIPTGYRGFSLVIGTVYEYEPWSVCVDTFSSLFSYTGFEASYVQSPERISIIPNMSMTIFRLSIKAFFSLRNSTFRVLPPFFLFYKVLNTYVFHKL